MAIRWLLLILNDDAAGFESANTPSIGPVMPEVTMQRPASDAVHSVPSVQPARPTVTALARKSTPVKSTSGLWLY